VARLHTSAAALPRRFFSVNSARGWLPGREQMPQPARSSVGQYPRSARVAKPAWGTASATLERRLGGITLWSSAAYLRLTFARRRNLWYRWIAVDYRTGRDAQCVCRDPQSEGTANRSFRLGAPYEKVDQRGRARGFCRRECGGRRRLGTGAFRGSAGSGGECTRSGSECAGGGADDADCARDVASETGEPQKRSQGDKEKEPRKID
jgi:hypothetical protein